jgi:hypothetical protein
MTDARCAPKSTTGDDRGFDTAADLKGAKALPKELDV